MPTVGMEGGSSCELFRDFYNIILTYSGPGGEVCPAGTVAGRLSLPGWEGSLHTAELLAGVLGAELRTLLGAEAHSCGFWRFCEAT